MERMLQDLARERRHFLVTEVDASRQAGRARKHSRVTRQAERAERRVVSQWDQARRLRLRVRELES